MRFTLKRPCNNCPFRTDVFPYLHTMRAHDIATTQETFTCHKTLEHDDDGELVRVPDSIHCAGFLIMR